jgi:hypothetical protein
MSPKALTHSLPVSHPISWHRGVGDPRDRQLPAADLHRNLSDIARAPGSTISVITIEYDIRDDKPEGTDVFELEPSSIDLIAKLIAARFRQLSLIDAQTIADVSGGNARIAIALAETVRAGESIKGLTDAELFKRLFEQRHGYNEPLEAIAQAVSLVYSFDGENAEARMPSWPFSDASSASPRPKCFAA